MNDTSHQLIVEAAHQGLRLDQFLSQSFEHYSRTQLKRWIEAGHVFINQQSITQARHRVHINDSIMLTPPPIEATSLEAQDIPLDCIYQDEHLIVINKPAGLVVHPGAGQPDQTLVNALLHFDPELATLPRAGLVHRLDKHTTGLLLIARSPEALQGCITALQQREIKRFYQAVVIGRVISGGTIDAPIGRHPQQRVKMSVRESGKPAVTHYRLIKRFRAHTHLQVQLETGRTHQIRVHMSHLGFPLIGDREYRRQLALAAPIGEPLKNTIAAFPRQALHAYSLGLSHPITGQALTWEAPLPEDFVQLLSALEEDLK